MPNTLQTFKSYRLITDRRAVLMSFDDKTKAIAMAKRQKSKHGARSPNLTLVEVLTTIEEKVISLDQKEVGMEISLF